MGVGDIATWVVVLIKDFGTAKQRLAPALGARPRRALARRNARLAIAAASAGDRVLVVAGGSAAAALAQAAGVEVLLEPRQEGQNVAARRGINRAVESGAEAVLVLSSDLPLITRAAVRELLDRVATLPGPLAAAAPAVGRGGTNALYLRPPEALSLHFGDDSFAKFRHEAEQRGIPFIEHTSDAMALDLDEPADLARLRRAV